MPSCLDRFILGGSIIERAATRESWHRQHADMSVVVVLVLDDIRAEGSGETFFKTSRCIRISRLNAESAMLFDHSGLSSSETIPTNRV